MRILGKLVLEDKFSWSKLVLEDKFSWTPNELLKMIQTINNVYLEEGMPGQIVTSRRTGLSDIGLRPPIHEQN
jgi:hypothetical protein